MPAPQPRRKHMDTQNQEMATDFVRPSAWIIDYVCGEWWTFYAETPHEQWAKEIAEMLRLKGNTVRISAKLFGVRLGEPLEPPTAPTEPGPLNDTAG